MTLTPDEFARVCDVSRETLQRLESYAATLIKWQKTVNLVAAGTLDDLWRRHMLDSAQLRVHLPPRVECLVDMGSGAGFPGLVMAILGVSTVHLIESDARKCVFLAEAARAAGLAVGQNPILHRCRIEEVRGLQADAVTARACAPLTQLLVYAEPFLGAGSLCLFPKGGRVDEELTEAAKTWRMDVERFPSLSDPSGTILRIGQVARAGL